MALLARHERSLLVDSSGARIAFAASGTFFSTRPRHTAPVAHLFRYVAEHADAKIFVDNLKVEILGRLSRHFSQPLNTFSTAAAWSRENFFLTTTLPRG